MRQYFLEFIVCQTVNYHLIKECPRLMAVPTNVTCVGFQYEQHIRDLIQSQF